MRILVHHQGQQLGPFTVEELRAALAAGRIGAQDLAWWEGAPAWAPVTSIPGLGGVDVPGAAPMGTAAGEGAGLALASLILGILSVIACTFVTGIPAVICGHMALARKSRTGAAEGKGLAIAGLVTGYAGTVLTLAIIAILASIAVPAFGEAQAQAKLTRSKSNARTLAVAVSTYAATNNGKFPDTLDEALKTIGMNPSSSSILTDPLAPELGNNGYVYMKPTGSDPPNKVIIASRGKDKRGRRAVAFHDGSAQIMIYSLPADL